MHLREAIVNHLQVPPELMVVTTLSGRGDKLSRSHRSVLLPLHHQSVIDTLSPR